MYLNIKVCMIMYVIYEYNTHAGKNCVCMYMLIYIEIPFSFCCLLIFFCFQHKLFMFRTTCLSLLFICLYKSQFLSSHIFFLNSYIHKLYLFCFMCVGTRSFLLIMLPNGLSTDDYNII